MEIFLSMRLRIQILLLILTLTYLALVLVKRLKFLLWARRFYLMKIIGLWDVGLETMAGLLVG